MDAIYKKVLNACERFLEGESSGHDLSHALRVFNNAMHIRSAEGGDPLIIGIAAIVHDVCRPWEKVSGKAHFSDEALDLIGDLLAKCELDRAVIVAVLEIVREHDVYDWTNKNIHKSLELKIVQDADNLDAIGAIGIGRTFAFGGANGLSMYYPGEDLNFIADFVEDPQKRTSTIAHFYEKLLKLKDQMNTNTGLKMAAGRHKVMEEFLAHFFSEWEGAE